jgi:hypothetical protein
LGNSNKNLPPYVSAAYLFINSLPLSTLKEKYTELVNGVDILDLYYLFACFKKNSALHKLPYAWVLKIGSIWNRYKVWKEKNFDYLEEIWKDFDYMKNFDPENKNVLNYVYDVIDNGAKIIKTSILNIDTKKRNDSGYYYLDNLGISVQGVDSNKCMLEIISQCLCYNIKIMMKIQLENNKLVNISF